MRLLAEAFIVGIVLLLIGSGVSSLVNISGLSKKLPDICSTWNENYIMEISLFLTGFLAHILFEFAGANKWYCKYGNACKK